MKGNIKMKKKNKVKMTKEQIERKKKKIIRTFISIIAIIIDKLI